MGNGNCLGFKKKCDNGTLKVQHQREPEDNKLLIKNGWMDNFEHCSLKLFDAIDRWCVPEDTEEEQTTLDKFELNQNVDLNMASNEKDMEKDVLDIK